MERKGIRKAMSKESSRKGNAKGAASPLRRPSVSGGNPDRSPLRSAAAHVPINAVEMPLPCHTEHSTANLGTWQNLLEIQNKRNIIMKFTLSRAAMNAAVLPPSKAAPAKTAVPILESLLLECKDNILKITGSDQNVTIQTRITVEGCEPGAVCVNAKILTDLLGTIDAKEILHFEVADDKSITCKWNNGMGTMPYFDAAEYPDVIRTDEMPMKAEINGKDLGELIQSVRFATKNTDELQPALAAVYLAFAKKEKTVTAVATDGRLLAISSTPAEDTDTLTDGTVLLPKKSAELIRNFVQSTDEPVLLEASKDCLRVTLDDEVIECRTLNHKYVPYDKVIPKNNDKTLVISREALKSALGRLLICSNQTTPGIILSLNPMGLVSMKSEDLGRNTRANEELDASYEGAELTLAVRGDNLSETLDSFRTEKVKITLADEKKPLVITPAEDDEQEENTSHMVILVPIVILKQ